MSHELLLLRAALSLNLFCPTYTGRTIQQHHVTDRKTDECVCLFDALSLRQNPSVSLVGVPTSLCPSCAPTAGFILAALGVWCADGTG